MPHLLDQLYKTKLQLAAVVFVSLGVALLVLSRAVASVPPLGWLVGWPASELGAVLAGVGLFGIVFEYYARQEAEARIDARLEAAVRRGAPAIRDAVLDSFAFHPSVLREVASPELLDRIASNAIGLRLGDQALAEDIYTDLRDQVIAAPERLHDVHTTVTLTPWSDGPASGHGSMFEVTLRCEYRVRPASSTMRFACVADLTEYRELLRDPTVQVPWHFETVAGVDAADPAAFKLLQLSVDGKPRQIRRTTRKGAQIFSVNLGPATTTGDEITIVFVYRVLVQRHSHLLHLDLPRPTKGAYFQLHYAGTGIRFVNTLDYFASSQRARVNASTDTSAKTVDVGFDGWVFPRSGVVFVWVLEDELDAVGARR